MNHIITKQSFFAKIIALIAHIGADPNDSENLKFRRLLFVGSVLFLATPASTLLGIISCVLGEPLMGAPSFVFAGLGLLIVFLINLIPRYINILINCGLLNVLLTPYLSIFISGGLKNLDVGIIWSFMCPLGALVMTERKIAFRWFLGYLILFISIFFLQPYLHSTNHFSPTMVLVIMMINIIGSSSVIFALFNYFVSQKDIFQKKVENAYALLSKYVAPQLADTISIGEIDSIWRHNRKKLTLFFSDIKDFTRITDALEPEDMARLLNEYLTEMNKIINKYEGTLAQVIGDGLYVFFGAPHQIARLHFFLLHIDQSF